MDEKKRILIAEDEKPMARALELKLTHAGYEVKVANDGEVAMNLINEEPFSLILLDLVMPKKDGFKVLKEMKEKSILTPVIVLSNLSQEEDERKVKELGAKDYLVKSNTPIANIVSNINSFLN
jgi:DNA-binding response OmpR family regulator